MITSLIRRICAISFIGLTLFSCAEVPAPFPTNTPEPIPPSAEPPTPTLIPTRMPEELREQIRDNYLAASFPLLDEWASTNLLANNRSRPDWLDQVNQLLSIRSNYAQLEVDPSLEALHNQMLLHMDCQIAAYMAFLRPEDYAFFDTETDPQGSFERCSLPGTN